MLRYLSSLSNFFCAQTNWACRSKISNQTFNYESLEARRVLAGISFDLPSGHLTITGSAGNDISFVTVPGDGQIQVSLTGFASQTFNSSTVNRIFFYGLDGADFFRNQSSIASEAFGGEGNDILHGGSGNDRLEGENGDDVLTGGDGNDTLLGGAGNDRLTGGLGMDVLDGGEDNDRLFGTAGLNQLYGGEGDDQIWGGTGNDSIWGGAGNDFIYTGEGANFADGGEGNDIITTADTISNFMIGGEGDDYIVGGAGNDRIEGGAGNDRLFGGIGDDTIFGGSGNDLIRGGDGHDFLHGADGIDTIFGDDGNDEIIGGADNDRLFGGTGNDRILGDAGNDEIQGGAGDDEIYGGDGDDLIYGGDGDDLIRAGAGNDSVYGQAGNDTIFGQDGDDLLNGGSDDDILHGQEGNDRLIGSFGNDRLFGGNGNDFLSAGDGDNGLFGGVNGTKQLVSGSGKNRFLLAESANNQVFSFKASDARVHFRNGLSLWSNTEIRVVDDMLHAMHMRAGTTRVLEGTETNRPVVFIKDHTIDSPRYGTNELATIELVTVNPNTGLPQTITYREHQIRLPEWDEFNDSTNLMVSAEVAREIAYNWASTEAMSNVHFSLNGVFPSFSSYSGWTNVMPDPGVISDYWLSLDQQWWYIKNTLFTEHYARTNPAADFAAVWKFYFDFSVTPAQRVPFTDKIDYIDDFFAKLGPLA